MIQHFPVHDQIGNVKIQLRSIISESQRFKVSRNQRGTTTSLVKPGHCFGVVQILIEVLIDKLRVKRVGDVPCRTKPARFRFVFLIIEAGSEILNIWTIASVVISGHANSQRPLYKRRTIGDLGIQSIVVRSGELYIAFGFVNIGSLGNDVNGARRRGTALQGTLGTAQNFYTFQIVHLSKRYVRPHNRIIPIRIHRGSRARLRIHADPAHGDNIVTGIGTGKRQPSGLLLN